LGKVGHEVRIFSHDVLIVFDCWSRVRSTRLTTCSTTSARTTVHGSASETARVSRFVPVLFLFMGGGALHRMGQVS